MAKRLVYRRDVRPTVLMVGEGYAEESLLRHCRNSYTSGMQGCSLTIKNARGKGAANVVDCAHRHSLQAKYDYVAALLDTDADWNRTVERRAKSLGLIVLPSTPCIEAWLLEVVGDVRPGASSADYKQRFAQRFGSEAHTDGLIPQHFSKATLDQARHTVAILNDLLKILQV